VHELKESGVRRQEKGDRRKETGERRQEKGDRRKETGDWSPGAMSEPLL
jgi:hypothetical protein